MKKNTKAILVVIGFILTVLFMAMFFYFISNNQVKTTQDNLSSDYSGAAYTPEVQPASEIANQPINEQEEEILSNASMTDEAAYDILDLKKLNDLETYRGLMFKDYESGDLIAGAGLVKKIFKDNNITAVIVATEQEPFTYGGVYNRAEFTGRYAVVIFRGKPKVLVDDILLFKGIITNKFYTPSDDYRFKENMPLLMGLYYETGDFNVGTVVEYFVNPATKARASAYVQAERSAMDKRRAEADSAADAAANAADAAAIVATTSTIDTATTADTATTQTE